MELELQESEQQRNVCLPCAGVQVPAAREMGCKDSEAIATAGGAGELMGCPSIYDPRARL